MRRLKIYEENPSATEIGKAVEVLREGGIVIYPTDTIYALGCDALNVRAVERICQSSKSQSVDYLSGIELGE